MKRLLLVVVCVGVAILWWRLLAPTSPPYVQESSPQQEVPLERSSERITKKLFGTFVTQTNSPVSPERFRGYHAGTDFEILPGEEDVDVRVYTACDGPITAKRWVSGYGGLVIQACQLDGQTVTVLYGHIRLASVMEAIGAQMYRGAYLGVLGDGYSSETDNERKHLHLGVHRGSSMVLAGYVQSQDPLASWMNPEALLNR